MHGKSRELHAKLSTRKSEERETLGITDDVYKIVKKWYQCRRCRKHHTALAHFIECDTYLDSVRDC